MPEATAVGREATAVLDQFSCRDHVDLFHLCVQARGSGSDEVGSRRDAAVEVAEGVNSRRDMRIQFGETRA
jgi:hypothetical protein